jgi:DNA replication protein DnaC
VREESIENENSNSNATTPPTPANGDGGELEDFERSAAQRRAANKLREERRDLILQVGVRYKHCKLRNFHVYKPDAQRPVVDALKTWGLNLAEHIDAGAGLVFFGPPGTGKDHLMMAMMMRAFDLGRNVCWLNGMEFYAALRDGMDVSASERGFLLKYASKAVLAISDPLPPDGPLTTFQAAKLFELVDMRYRRLLPTWVTMNVASRKEAELRLGLATVDRLTDNALTCYCNWPSYRQRGQ